MGVESLIDDVCDSKVGLYQFQFDAGRYGSISALFVCSEHLIEYCKGECIWLYEVLGKHTEWDIVLGDRNMSLVSDNSSFVYEFVREVGTSFGMNPLFYVDGIEELVDTLYSSVKERSEYEYA